MNVVVADPRSPDAQQLLDELSASLATITGSPGTASFDLDDMLDSRARFMSAYVDGRPVGCGALRPLNASVAELKRMYARPGTKGVGAALLVALEREAHALAYREIWLETRVVNTRAVRFYEMHGYTRIPNYGKYAGRADAICFAKRL